VLMIESEDAIIPLILGSSVRMPFLHSSRSVTSFSWSHEDGEREVGEEGFELPIVIKLARNGTVTMCISKQTPSVRANSY